MVRENARPRIYIYFCPSTCHFVLFWFCFCFVRLFTPCICMSVSFIAEPELINIRLSDVRISIRFTKIYLFGACVWHCDTVTYSMFVCLFVLHASHSIFLYYFLCIFFFSVLLCGEQELSNCCFSFLFTSLQSMFCSKLSFSFANIAFILRLFVLFYIFYIFFLIVLVSGTQKFHTHTRHFATLICIK